MSREEYIRKLESEKYRIEPGQEVQVDLFKQEDAIGVSRCYYAVYGGGFPLEYVYSPDEVVKAFTPPDHYTAVARTPKGDIVGLLSLFRSAPSSRVYEAGQFMVLPEYRKSSVATRLNKYLFDSLAPSLDLHTVFVEAVCNHVISQKLAEKGGLQEFALELDAMPVESFREGDAAGRVSLLLCFRQYKELTFTVFLPEMYRSFLENLYTGGNLHRDIQWVRGGSPSSERSVYTEKRFESAGVARLNVEKTGQDFKSVLDEFENDPSAAVREVYVNLGDSGNGHALDELKNRGYIRGGILPCWFDTDALLMQKTVMKPNFEGVQLYSEKAKAIFNFIRDEWNGLDRA